MPGAKERDDGSPPREVSIELLHQQLRNGIDAIESGEDWRAWLDFARRLYQYSFNNLILVWRQRPDATSIASYRTWQSVHRQVRRGERALRVMAPILRRADLTDNEGRVILDRDGRPRKRQQVVGYRPAAVFDISQTDGPPLPEPQRPALLAGAAPAGLWEALQREVNERGYRLLRAGSGGLNGANGVTKAREREVWVRDDVDEAQAVKTLAHELAHVVLHAPSDESGPLLPSASIREVEAESVAHLVLAAHGVTTAAFSFPYVAGWAYPLAAVEHVAMSEIVSRTGTRVMDAARDLINATTTTDTGRSSAETALIARVADGASRTAELLEKAVSTGLTPDDRAALVAVLADTHAFYQRSVRSSWVPDYLETRGLGAALDSHEVGYAPKSWTMLTDHLRSLGYTDEHIEAAGVAKRSQHGHLLDHLRDRLTIPIRNLDHDVVGFTARSNPQARARPNEPKYLNTPTTALFQKGKILFGLPEHLDEVRAGALPVLCEGPLDAIAVDRLTAAAGLPVVGLAAIGTAFTDAQCRRLLAAVEDRGICLAFDADPAGMAATERTWTMLTEHGPRPVVAAVLPADEDPSSLLATAPDVLSSSLANAQPAGAVLAEQKIRDARLEGDAGRELLAFRQLVDLAARMPRAERPPYLLRVANLLHIEVGAAAAEVGERHPRLLEERPLSVEPRGSEVLLEVLRAERVIDPHHAGLVVDPARLCESARESTLRAPTGEANARRA